MNGIPETLQGLIPAEVRVDCEVLCWTGYLELACTACLRFRSSPDAQYTVVRI